MDGFDRDLTIRTILGEAKNQGALGQAAVAHVIMNRVAAGKYGDTPSEVVLAKHQFEPWSTRRKELMSIPRTSDDYVKVGRLVDAIASGKTPDPTNGATHFANVGTVKDRNGGTVGNHTWINPKALTAEIGAHTFFAPDGKVDWSGTPLSTPPNKPSTVMAFAGQDTNGASKAMSPAEAMFAQLMKGSGGQQQPAQPQGFQLRGSLGRLLSNGIGGFGWHAGPSGTYSMQGATTPPDGSPPVQTGFPQPPAPAPDLPVDQTGKVDVSSMLPPNPGDSPTNIAPGVDLSPPLTDAPLPVARPSDQDLLAANPTAMAAMPQAPVAPPDSTGLLKKLTNPPGTVGAIDPDKVGSIGELGSGAGGIGASLASLFGLG